MLKLLCLVLSCAVVTASQNSVGPGKPAPVEKLGPHQFRLNRIRVDTATREISAPGFVNNGVERLEFVANTKNGAKAYESALTIDTDAVTFNAALLMIGLDPARGRPSKTQFDPTPPEGDPVDVAVEIARHDGVKRFKIEDLLYDQRTKATVPAGPWVYTGSTIIDTGFGPRYLAELDGVLIGLMHGPQAIIDNPRNDAYNGFGAIVLNPHIGIPPGAAVTLKVKALNR